MQNLKNKRFGANGSLSVTLLTVPAMQALQLKRRLLALVGEPLAAALAKPAAGVQSETARGAMIGIEAIAGVMARLSDAELSELLTMMGRYIHVDGRPLNVDEQFTAGTLSVLYEVLWFFLSETYGDFFDAVRSRLNLSASWTESSLSSPQT